MKRISNKIYETAYVRLKKIAILLYHKIYVKNLEKPHLNLKIAIYIRSD